MQFRQDSNATPIATTTAGNATMETGETREVRTQPGRRTGMTIHSCNWSKSICNSRTSSAQCVCMSLARWLIHRPPPAATDKNTLAVLLEEPPKAAEVSLPFISSVFPLAEEAQLAQTNDSERDVSFPSDLLRPWGNSLPTCEVETNLRIVYQNVGHVLHPSSQDPSTTQVVLGLIGLECGIFCAAETNVN